MANKFPIEITADDAVIATIKRINDSLSRLGRPVKQLTAYTQKLGNAAGFDRLAAGTRKFASATKAAWTHLSALATPLTALIGGGTLAGIAAMTDSWARLNFYIDRTARSAGLSVGEFQALRGAAIGLGMDANSLGGDFKGFADVLQGAQFGRNPEALVMLNRMGIILRRNKDGSNDTADAFKQLADVIKGKSPEIQRLIARQFGLEGQLPLLSKGRAGIDALEANARAHGAVPSERQSQLADRLALSMSQLKLAAAGLQNEVASRLAPGMTAFFDHLTGWIDANRGRIGSFFERIGAWLAKLDFDKIATGASKFLDKLDHIVDQLGGFKTILAGMGALMLANLLAPFATLLTTMVTLVPALAAAWPILAAIGALAGTAYVGYRTYDFLKNNPGGINVGGGIGVGGRQNNPLNLRHWGMQPENAGFAAFGSQLEGYTAGAYQLELYGKRGINSLNRIISTWAPVKDGNDVGAYVKDVAGQTGFDPNQALNLRDPAVLSPLLSAMTRHEQGAGFGIDSNVIAQAVANAIATAGPQKVAITFPGLAPGLQPVVTGGGAGNVTVGTRMPGFGP